MKLIAIIAGVGIVAVLLVLAWHVVGSAVAVVPVVAGLAVSRRRVVRSRARAEKTRRMAQSVREASRTVDAYGEADALTARARARLDRLAETRAALNAAKRGRS